MNEELKNSRQVIAVLTVEDIEEFLWEEEIQQLNTLLEKIEDGRKEKGKKPSRVLICN